VTSPIVFEPNEQDAENLAILEVLGLTAHTAIRIALTSLAADMTPVAVAMREGALVAA
jgi:antitoxin component of RelBE/YafQ-DinJ toxin-antitoxin module